MFVSFVSKTFEFCKDSNSHFNYKHASLKFLEELFSTMTPENIKEFIFTSDPIGEHDVSTASTIKEGETWFSSPVDSWSNNKLLQFICLCEFKKVYSLNYFF